MARDKVLPPRNCFCAYVKMDINNLNDTFFEMVRDKDCGPQLYTANYDKSIDDNINRCTVKIVSVIMTKLIIKWHTIYH